MKITTSLPFTTAELAGLAAELNAIRRRELPALRQLWGLADKYLSGHTGMREHSEHEQETIRNQYWSLRHELRCCGSDGLPEWMMDDVKDLHSPAHAQHGEIYRKWFLGKTAEDIHWPIVTA